MGERVVEHHEHRQVIGGHPEVLEARIAFRVSLRKFEEAVTFARLLERFYPGRKGIIPKLMRRFSLDGPAAVKEPSSFLILVAI